ncbi:nitrate- and nitrite sensing domain-containing protein [Streptomyces sp. RK75]|uniref:sensor histidine kinase n=1 Tax=Streptomyces sp. RK75 TaxID=2824895 RepID=UPI001B399976|nr:nitrate- and nitrite sensing domain-containing protein [Streptomyces sp. RK75]MBQ0865105.1 nitrate- and nitrite sensing domain-containing protein [Streptomyces sp. RK75]
MGRRRARVRNRLLVSVAVGAVAVVAAGAPTLVAGSQDTADAQELVDLARLNQQAIALSHSLADERDGMIEYIAAGRSSKDGVGVSEAQRNRVDRQARELRTAASSAASGPAAPSDSPRTVAKALKKLPSIRQRAMTGKGDPLDSYEAYSGVIRTLRDLTRGVADGLPARAENRTAAALPDLARAVDQASATRGLLEAALTGQGTQRALVTAAGKARLREQAALADFEETADTKARESYSTTVNGADVTIAERYLKAVTARTHLTASARAVDRERFDSSVSARLAHMRGVQSSFAAAEVKRLEGLRDDDVTALQLRAGLVGGCLLLAVAISVATARSLTRPLSVLKRGSQRLAKDPSGEEPITFRGRNDEFTDVVRAINTLRATTAELRRRSACAEREQDQLAVEKAQLTEKHQLLGEDFAALRAELETVREQLAAPAPHGIGADMSKGPGPGPDVRQDARAGSDAGVAVAGAAADHGAFADLGTRTLTLVERQLGIIEGMEEKEADPDRLDTLFKLDHLATRMRRHSENLLLLADAERTERDISSAALPPAPLLDVLRAAVSEIAQYERVELGALPPEARVSGPAADDLSHLIAELLDNAAAFSPVESGVRLSARVLESGEAQVSVEDEGEGMPESLLAELNDRLSEPQAAWEAPGTSSPWGLGMFVVARLSARHGIRVQLRKPTTQGTVADVTVPRALLPGSAHPSDVAEPSRTNDEDQHSRADDLAPTQAEEPAAQSTSGAAAESTSGAAADQSAVPAEQPGSVTHPGLPQRVRRETPREPSTPHPRKGGVTAEELRRKLDMFQQGAREGLRDAGTGAHAGSGDGAHVAPSAPGTAAEPEQTTQEQQAPKERQAAPAPQQDQRDQQADRTARARQTEDTDHAEERAGAQGDGGTAKEARQ